MKLSYINFSKLRNSTIDRDSSNLSGRLIFFAKTATDLLRLVKLKSFTFR